jgi:hypothetical protein
MTMTSHPALVLNADFRPMSYFPLTLLSWQDAVQAVVGQRVSVVAEHDAWARTSSADEANTSPQYWQVKRSRRNTLEAREGDTPRVALRKYQSAATDGNRICVDGLR